VYCPTGVSLYRFRAHVDVADTRVTCIACALGVRAGSNQEETT